MAKPKIKRRLVDWESIYPLFKAGLISNSEICRQYERDHKNSQVYKTTVTEGAIRKQAKMKGWKKDLARKVKTQVKENLIRDQVRDQENIELTDQEIIEKAAALPTEIRKLQRVRTQELSELGDNLQSILVGFVSKELKAAKQEGGSTSRLALNSHCKMFDKLVVSRARLQKMENDAFSLEDEVTGGKTFEEFLEGLGS